MAESMFTAEVAPGKRRYKYVVITAIDASDNFLSSYSIAGSKVSNICFIKAVIADLSIRGSNAGL